jgi:hypothetical protein
MPAASSRPAGADTDDVLPHLADLASCQAVHDLSIGFEEVEAGKIFRARPDKPFKFPILGHSGVPGNPEKLQANTKTVRITVVGPVDLGADLCVDPQLFRKLSAQACLRHLAGFDLAAGKLPLQPEPVSGFSLADENALTVRQDTRRDENHPRARAPI